MKFNIATLVFLACLATKASCANTSAGISYEDFNQILTSEAFTQFDGNDVEQQWEDATTEEWNRAQNAEESSQEKFPFVVCHRGSDMSGFMRHMNLEDVIRTNTSISVASNTNDQTCFIMNLVASVATEVSKLEKVFVQPLLPSMKMRVDTINNVRDRVDRHRGYLKTYPEQIFGDELPDGFVFHMSLCEEFKEEGAENLFQSIQMRDECSVMREGIKAELSKSKSNLFVTIPLTKMMSESPEAFTNPFSLTGDIHSTCIENFIVEVSSHPRICSIEVVPEMEFLNLEAQWILQSGSQDYRPFTDAGLSGTGQVVSVSDSGLDVDNCYFWDSSGDIELNGEVDQSRRKIVQYTPYASGGDWKYGHGTHVCGTIVGHKAVDGVAESHGFADGTAKNAKVAFFDIGRRFLKILKLPNQISTVLAAGTAANANLHSASWGSKSSAYDSSAAQFDEYAFDNPDHLSLIAAGNSGSGNTANSIGSPATAKNVISVGASHSYGQDLTSSQQSADYMAYFSSRGPTDDGRTKPDIVAPGFSILSAGGLPREVGECDPESIPNGMKPPSGKSAGLTFMAGTSMATPATSGIAALVRQYMEDGWFPSGQANAENAINPSGALVKAILLNGGQNMVGVDNGSGPVFNVQPYDSVVNYGRVSLLHSLPLQGHNDLGAWMTDREEIDDGETNSWTVDITDCNDASEVSATLVWTDPPATSGCRSCVLNNLDLTAEKSGSTGAIFPNGLTGPDSINNVERIRVSVEEGDEITFKVEATNLSTASQSYALIITGCMASEPCVNCQEMSSLSTMNQVADGAQSTSRGLRKA